MKEHILYYQRLLDHDPHNVDARLRLGAVWRSLARHDLAVPQYAAAARQLAKDGLLLEAIAACKAIFEMEPSHTETQLFLASLYARQPAGGAVVRVVEPPPPDAVDADELIVLQPTDAVQEFSEEELEASILESLDGEPVDDETGDEEDLDLLTTHELDTLTRAADARDDLEADELDDMERRLTIERPAPGIFRRLADGDGLDERTTVERPGLFTAHLPTPPSLPAPPTEAPRGVSINYPDRVLRRALNLSMSWDANRPGHPHARPPANEPHTVEIPDALLDSLNAEPERLPEAPSTPPPVGDSDSWPRATPTDDPRRTTDARQVPRPKRPEAPPTTDRPRTGSGPWPVPASNADHHGATRVASIFTDHTVVSQTGSGPRPLPLPPLPEPPPAGDSSGHTRVARPHPGVAPIVEPADPLALPTPAAATPSYDRIEVVSPAALSVTRRDVPNTPLFSRMSPQTFMDLLKRIDLRRIPAGENVIDDDHRPLGLFIIINGQVDIMRRAADGTIKFLATMGRGEFFGEFELLTGRSHSAIVKATNAVDLLHLSDEVIADLAESDPTIWDVLWDFYHQRLLNNLLATSPLFHALGAAERSALATRFERHFVDAGDNIVRRGARGAGLYLILNGAVDVIDPEHEPEILTRLRDGDFFGTVSSVKGQPATATVRAAEDSTLLVLDRESLRAVMDSHSETRAAIEALVENRLMLAGRTGYSRLGMPK